MNESDFAVLKERYDNLSLQMGRIVSHIESERDRIVEVSKRVDTANGSLERLQKQADKFEKILLNGGKEGLVFKVGSLERDAENSDKSWHRWAAMAGGLSGAAALVIEILKN